MFFAISYNTAQKLASQYVSVPIAAAVSGVTAFVLLSIFLLFYKLSGQRLVYSPKGVLFAILIGVCATGIEIFGVLGYSKGVPFVVGQVVTSIVQITMIILYSTFLFHEGITTQRILALILAVLASFLATK